MNTSKWRVIVLAIAVISIAALWQLRSNALITAAMSALYREYFAKNAPEDPQLLSELTEITRQKAIFYERLIQMNHLDQGMVVNRTDAARVIDHCDSLLFSSLRYVALKKLGLELEATAAWEAILASRDGGKWFRHPQCAHKSTSRDMIIGLLAALTQKPPGYRDILVELMGYLDANAGYVGDGPFYVSYLSPGLAEILRHFARLEGIDSAELPAVVRYGFSTMELDTYTAKRGFEMHLVAMVLWIEQELKRSESQSQQPVMALRALPLPLERVTRALWGVKVTQQRWAWLAQRLVDADAKNLFFRWLRLATADALTPRARLTLLRDLAAMPQFPADRLPSSCERRADYLWQRASHEYVAKTSDCRYHFSGVDYLWMASLMVAPH